MKLTDFLQGNVQVNQGSETEAAGAPVFEISKNALANKMLMNMMAGQTIQGEIVGKNGTSLLLKMGEEALIQAKVNLGTSFEMGKIMTFEVKSKNNSSITLSPLFENTARDENVLKALDMAKLPVNERTIEMTEMLMKEGMPIDKNHLQQMFRQLLAFPEQDVQSIVMLNKMEIPVTAQNLEQFAQYMKGEHALVNGMEEVFGQLPLEITSLFEQGQIREGAMLLKELFSIISEGTQGVENTLSEQAVLVEAGTGNAAGEEAIILQGEHGQPQSEAAQTKGEANLNLPQGDMNTLGALLGEEEMAGLQRLLPEADSLGQWKAGQLFQALSNLDLAALEKEHAVLSKLFQKPEFQRLMNTELAKQWMLLPQEAEDKETVQKLYERSGRQLERLDTMLNEIAKQDGALGKAVNQLRGNLDFINQMNHLYTYVQLPVKMQNQNANGDLYVFTNKRSLAKKDGNVSALLHLDMENLGPLDIYVAMENQKVNTQFYVKNDEILDFLNEHMDLLTKRLQERGYDVTIGSQTREEKKDGFLAMVKVEKESQGEALLMQYSFDVRA